MAFKIPFKGNFPSWSQSPSYQKKLFPTPSTPFPPNCCKMFDFWITNLGNLNITSLEFKLKPKCSLMLTRSLTNLVAVTGISYQYVTSYVTIELYIMFYLLKTVKGYGIYDTLIYMYVVNGEPWYQIAYQSSYHRDTLWEISGNKCFTQL